MSTTLKQQPLQQSPRQSLQTKGKISKEAQLRVGTINIEEKINLSQHCASFVGGKLKKYYENWKRFTKDPHILGIIKVVLKIDFSEVPFQSGYKIHLRSVQESNNLLAEVRKLLGEGVIVKCKPQFGDYFTAAFTRNKKDNTKRLKLNLKSLNQSVKYKYVKMKSIKNLLNMIEPGVFMVSIDLKDVFFSVPIYEDHQKCLIFFFFFCRRLL